MMSANYTGESTPAYSVSQSTSEVCVEGRVHDVPDKVPSCQVPCQCTCDSKTRKWFSLRGPCAQHKRSWGEILMTCLGDLCCITGLAIPCCPLVCCLHLWCTHL